MGGSMARKMQRSALVFFPGLASIQLFSAQLFYRKLMTFLLANYFSKNYYPKKKTTREYRPARQVTPRTALISLLFLMTLSTLDCLYVCSVCSTLCAYLLVSSLTSLRATSFQFLTGCRHAL